MDIFGNEYSVNHRRCVSWTEQKVELAFSWAKILRNFLEDNHHQWTHDYDDDYKMDLVF